MTQLSKNFSLEELKRSDKAEELGDPNTPNAQEIKNLKLLCTKILQPLRDEIGVGIVINSGFRNERVNKAVGGVSTSAHRLGYAADLHCPNYAGGNVRELCLYVEKFLKTNKIAFDQLIYEFVGGARWLYIGIKNANGAQRGQVLTIRNKKVYVGIANV